MNTDNILYFGSDDGLLSKEIYCCDIKDLSIVYDCITIPFDKNYFDIVIVNFILHYNILSEIKRVSKKFIIFLLSYKKIDINIL